MTEKFRGWDVRGFFQTCLILLLVDLLVFPPGLSASGILWNGGTGNYSDTTQWTCGTCSAPAYPNNGIGGLTYEGIINSGLGDVVTLDTAGVVVNSMTLGGSGSAESSIFNVTNGNDITFGTPSIASGNVLTVSNGGVLNVNNGGTAALELSGGASGLNDNGGQINVTDGGTFTLQNTAGGSSTLTNNGNISVIGTNNAATLQVNDGGSGATFAISGPGSLTLGGQGQVVVGSGSSLTVGSTLTNWNSGTSTLTGGGYSVGNGGTLQLSSIGAGNSIQNIAGNATVSVTGTGLLTGDGTTNSLKGLTSITDSSLTLSGVTGLTITPGGTPATLTLAATTSGIPANLTLDQSSNVTVSGAFTNSVNTTNGPVANTSTLTVQNGSTLTTGAFLNQSVVGGPILQSATANVNVTNGSTLNVDSLTTSTNDGFSNSNINVTGSSLNVTNDFQQGGTGANMSSGNDTLNLTNSTATVGGNFSNNNGLNTSIVNVNNSQLTVDGSFTQTQTQGWGSSALNISDGSTVTVGGLSNSNFATNPGTTQFAAQSQVSVIGGSVLNIMGNGTFTNVTSGGLLSGGGYYIGPGSSISYTGADINTIDANTSLTLVEDGALNNDNGGAHNAIASLTTNNGSLALLDGASLSLTTLTNVSSGGVLTSGVFEVGNGSTLSYQNAGDINTIGTDASLTLDGTGKVVSNSGNPDALSNSLNLVNGTFTLQNGANLVLSSAVPSFTNAGTVNVLNGSTLDVSNTPFTNVTSGGTLSGGSYTIGTDSTLNYAGPSNVNTIDFNTSLTLDNSQTDNTGMLTNGGVDAISNSLTTNNGTLGLQNFATLTLAQPFTNNGTVNVDTTGSYGNSTLISNGGITNYNATFNVANVSTLTVNSGGFLNQSDDSQGSGTATLSLGSINASTASVTGGLTNTANTYNGGSATSTVSLGSSSNMSVDNLTNSASVNSNAGFDTASAQINLTGASSLAVSGSVFNTAANNSLQGSGTATASISLDGGSSLTVGNGLSNYNAAVTLTNGSNLLVSAGGLLNSSDDSGYNSGSGYNGGNAQLSLSASTATVTGGLTNQANTYYGQTATSTVSLSNGSGLTVDNLTNSASAQTFNGFDTATAQINLTGASSLAVEGSLNNNTFVTDGSFGTASASISIDGNSSLTVGGLNLAPNTYALSNYNSTLSLTNGSSLTVSSNGLVNLSDDTNSNTASGTALLSLSASTANITGGLTNYAYAYNGGNANSIVSLTNGASLTVDNVTSTGNSSLGSATAQINLDGGSSLSVTGSLSQYAASLNLSSSGNNTVAIGGYLYNDDASSINLNGGGNLLTGQGGLTNYGTISVAAGDTADFRNGGGGILYNLTGNTLSAGTYNIGGNFFYDTGSDGSTYIQGLNGADITLTGSGMIGFGGGASNGGGAATNALLQLANLSNGAQLTLTNASLSINPLGDNSAMTLDPSLLTLNGASLSIAGAVNNNNGSNISLNYYGTASSLAIGGPLYNDYGSTINLNGGGNLLTAQGFTNNGSILVGAGDTADFRNGGAGQLTNLTGGTLYGGTYNISGSMFYDTGSDGSTYITALNGANVSLTGFGAILFGPGAGTNALSTSLNSIYSGSTGAASLSLTSIGTPLTFSPTGGTLAVSADDSVGSGSASLNLSSTTATITGAGGLTNTASVTGDNSVSSQVNLSDSSSLTVSNLTNTAINTSGDFGSASAQVNLTGGSSLAVSGGVSNITNNESFYGSANASINLTGSSLTVGGTFSNTGGSTLNLNNLSTATVAGLFTNGADSAVNLNGGGNTLYGTGGLTNNGTINVSAGDTADFRSGGLDTFTNLANGTLTGGALDVSGTFRYDASAGTGGGAILAMQSADITLNNGGQILYGTGGGSDGLAQLGALSSNSQLNLNGITETINPNGANGTFTLNDSSLNLNSYNSTPTALTIQGGLANTDSSTVDLYNQSTLTVHGAVTNDSSSSIYLAGGGNQLFAQGLTNNGTLTVGAGDTADFRGGTGQFTNLSANTLTGGTYNLYGQMFYSTGSDTSTYIQSLSDVNMALYNTGGVNPAGAILFGSGAGTDALAQLGAVNNSNLTLYGQTETFNPNGSNGTFTLSASTLTLNSYNSTPTALTIKGGLESTDSSINLYNQSTLTVQGGVTIDSNSGITLSGSGNSLFGTSLTNNGSLTVNSGSTADFRSGSGILSTLTGNTLTGGTYNIAGTLLYNTGTDGSTYIQTLNGVNMTLGNASSSIGFGSAPTAALSQLAMLTNSTLTINGGSLAINPLGTNSTFTLDPSTLTLSGATTLNIAGAVNNTSGSTINLTGGGNVLTAMGLTNNGNLIVGAGDTANFTTGGTDTFTNLANGVLSGGNYDIAGTFQFDPTSSANGGNILQIAADTTLTLDSWGGNSAAVQYGSGPGATDALTNLNEVTGTFNVGTSNNSSGGGVSMTQSFTPQGGTLTVDSGGAFNVASGLTWGGTTTVNVGGNLAVSNGGSMQLGGSDGGYAGVVNVSGSASNAGTINLYDSGSGIAVTGGSFVNTGTLNVNASGQSVTSLGLNNSGGTINIANGAVLDARVGGAAGTSTDTFTNLNGATGTLGGGGTFNVGGSFLFDPSSGTTGGNIYVIGTGTTLALTSSGAQVLYGPGAGTDAIASLTEVAGTLTLENGASHTFTPNGQTFAVDSTGTLNLLAGSNNLSITGSLVNNGTATLQGSSVLNVSQNLTNAGTFTQTDGNSSSVSITGNLNNSATGTYTVGYGSSTSALAVNNAAGGIINVDGGFNGAGGSLSASLGVDNSGTINVGAPWSGTGGGVVSAGAPVVNESTGTINVDGYASLTAPGFTNNGTLAVLAGGVANFEGGGAGSFTNLSGGTLTGGTYNIGGTFEFNGVNGVINNIATNTSLTLDAENGGLYQVISGIGINALASLAGNAGNLTLANGATLATDTTGGGPGTFTNTGTLATVINSGNTSNAFNVTGNLTNTSPGTINLNGAGDAITATGQFTNTGAVNLNGNNTSISSSGFDNQAGGTITLTANGNTLTSSAGASNEGTLLFNGTHGTLSSTGDFTNTGTLTTIGGGSSNAVNATGSIFNTSPGVVNLNGSGDKMTAADQFVNSGAVNLKGNNASVSSGGTSGTPGFDNQLGATVTLAGNTNSFTTTGTGSNEGMFTFSGSNGAVSSTGDFTNSSSGVVNMTGSNDTLSTQGSLSNEGSITIGNTESVAAALGLTQTGTITIDNGGKLTVQGGNTFDQTSGTTTINTGGQLTAGLVNLEGGTLTGGGTINGSVAVAGGTLNPGDPQTMTINGNYSQSASGILDLDLATPTSYDTIDVNGSVTLNGTLELTLEPGFNATIGTQFDVLNWTGNLTGDFATFFDPTFDFGTLTFQDVVHGDQLDLDVVAATEAAPEPSTLAMLFSAMLLGAGITWRARRRMTNVIE